VLVLGEIDLSVGYVAGIGGTITAILSHHNSVVGGHHRWDACHRAIGAVWGPRHPVAASSFVVTLAGLLGMEGLLLYLVNANGTGGPSG